ncbi:MAG TPA: helix-turn-helix transcriptional regulator [Chloroflexia bacterium]|nr:helix-turn-helix transcriptional regulator [Chloroflexia bacterium]
MARTTRTETTANGRDSSKESAAGVAADPLKQALEWDYGTAYEAIYSLHTILRPKEHGVPAPWAAGVRKRLSGPAQADLKALFSPPFGYLAYSPLHLVLEMDQPKTVERFLDRVQAIPDDEFTQRAHLPLVGNDNLERLINKGVNRKPVSDTDVEEYRHLIVQGGRVPPTAAEVRRFFSDVADPANTKKRWLALLREYQAVFFSEEEKRARPVLEKMLEQGQKLSRSMSVPDLIEKLSNGVTISPELDLKRLVLVPSIWLHPFSMRFEPADRELFFTWGAHPPGYRLVPGESVPDDALLVLRALGDPTRLRLLRLLATEPRSPQSLAIELKLSLPTVSHHIRELRVAGLIRLEIAGKGRESRYTVRWPSAERAFKQLEEFVTAGREE